MKLKLNTKINIDQEKLKKSMIKNKWNIIWIGLAIAILGGLNKINVLTLIGGFIIVVGGVTPRSLPKKEVKETPGVHKEVGVNATKKTLINEESLPKVGNGRKVKKVTIIEYEGSEKKWMKNYFWVLKHYFFHVYQFMPW